MTAARRVAPDSPAAPRSVAPWVLKLATLLDSRFRVPGTNVRFGLDPIIGLVPGVGDTVTAIIGALMIREALRLNVRRGVVAQMVGNLALDWALGLVPGLDLVLDTAFRAHDRNAQLLLRHAAKRVENTAAPPGKRRPR